MLKKLVALKSAANDNLDIETYWKKKKKVQCELLCKWLAIQSVFKCIYLFYCGSSKEIQKIN